MASSVPTTLNTGIVDIAKSRRTCYFSYKFPPVPNLSVASLTVLPILVSIPSRWSFWKNPYFPKHITYFFPSILSASIAVHNQPQPWYDSTTHLSRCSKPLQSWCQMLMRIWRKWHLPTLLVGKQNASATLESSEIISLKVNHVAPIEPSVRTTEHLFQ